MATSSEVNVRYVYVKITPSLQLLSRKPKNRGLLLCYARAGCADWNHSRCHMLPEEIVCIVIILTKEMLPSDWLSGLTMARAADRHCVLGFSVLGYLEGA
jgi:hypothetical protein